MILQIGLTVAEADIAILTKEREPLFLSFFDRSAVKVNAMAYGASNSYGHLDGTRLHIPRDTDFMKINKLVDMKRDRFTYCALVNKKIGKEYLITSKEDLYEDLYHFLMYNYTLPLMKEFIPYLCKEMKDKKCLVEIRNEVYSRNGMDRKIQLGSREISLQEVMVFQVKMSAAGLEGIVSEGLRKKKIQISEHQQRALCVQSFDDYIQRYGKSLVENLEKELNPLSPLNGELESVALKTKRLYPQQAVIGNGIKAAVANKLRYMLLNCGMGTGKTIMTAAAIDSYFNEKWLKKHPDKTLLDAYEEDQVNYRVVIMAPSHLLSTWEEEIKEEIPHARCTVITTLEQLIKLSGKRKEVKGRRFYVMSKDFMKLGSMVSPTPTKIRKKRPIANICLNCLETSLDMNYEPHIRLLKKEEPFEKEELGTVTLRYQLGRGRTAYCDACGGRRFHPVYIDSKERKGLVCPTCNQLLMKRTVRAADAKDMETDKFILGLVDFSRHTESNDTCYCCGSQLWSADVRNIDQCGIYNKKRPEKKWRKISHYRNFNRKMKATAFVLDGHVEEYMEEQRVTDYEYVTRENGPRRYSPAQFIKRKLGKGFFDFCVLDECHKYEGFGTGQSIAAHALVKSSKFTLGLTGTISNGTASSFFSLLFMLDPGRMKTKGYTFSSSAIMEFSRQYGVVETVYETTEDPVYHSLTKGRQKQEPRVKPGINPVLFIHFLMDIAVFLDLADMSSHIPPLEEKVMVCQLPDEVRNSLDCTMHTMKEYQERGENVMLMTEILNFGLFYPDKPYGREPIVSPNYEDVVICDPPGHQEYSDVGCLLPKEEKLVDIINAEIQEGRNVFVYASYTGKAETNVAPRLKAVIERWCNLKGRVQIIESAKPVAKERYGWIKKRAKDGIKVFICNPKVVETGVDFKFTFEGKDYNYPTIVFFQTGYELAVLWQASRRSYRLNQTEVSKVFWLCYKDTLQEEALYLMAKKMSAVSAVSGKFSTEGLTALAEGVDPRVALAQAMSKRDTSDRKSLENMFDVLAANTKEEETEEYKIMPTYYELGGREEEEGILAGLKQTTLMVAAVPMDGQKEEVPLGEKETEHGKGTDNADMLKEADVFADFFLFGLSKLSNKSHSKKKTEKRKKAEEVMTGQFTLF